MKVYRLAMKDNKTNKEIFFAKYNTKTQANTALRSAKKIANQPEIEFFVLEAEILEEKKGKK